MIRIGEIVKRNENQLMNVSQDYEMVVNSLASLKIDSAEKTLLACLVVSQTERKYKNFLVKVLLGLGKRSTEELIDDWQEDNLSLELSRLVIFLSDSEKSILDGLDMEIKLEDLEKANAGLFNDGFSNTFYPNKKLGTLYIRRLAKHRLNALGRFGDFEKLIVHFVMAQLLVSWESSCINLGLMLIDGWEVRRMSEWFRRIWPIYYDS